MVRQEIINAAQEMLDTQAKLATGVVDQAMMAEFGAKFYGFFAPKFDLKMGSKASMTGGTFPEMLKIANTIFSGIKNFKITNNITPVEGDDFKIKNVGSFDSVFTDCLGTEVPGTHKTYEFTSIICYDADCKITSWEQTWDETKFDGSRALEKEANNAIFEKNKELYTIMLGKWGSGEFNSTNPDAKKAAEECWAKDMVVDSSYPTVYTDQYRKYTGIQGGLDWCQYLEKTWDMPDFNVDAILPGPNGSVWSFNTYTPTHKGTGRGMPGKLEFIAEVGFNADGKCSYFKFFNAPSTIYQDQLAAPIEDTVKPIELTPPVPENGDDFETTSSIFGQMMASWGSGAMNVPDKTEGVKEVAKWFSKDAILDVRYPAGKVPALARMYKGHEGVWEWCRVTTGWEMPDFTVKHVTEGPNGCILAMMTNTPKVKATGKTPPEMTESIIRFVCKNGKIVHGTFYWGPKCVSFDATHAPEASKFFIVEHTFKENKADDWWKTITKTMSDPKKAAAMTNKQRECGFANHMFMPEGGEKPMYCLWEAKEETSKEAFQTFIDGPDGPGAEAMRNTVYQAMPGAGLPGTLFQVPDAPILPPPATTKGAFFWIHHEFKSPDTAKEFWNMMATMDMMKFTMRCNELGFHNHTFAPCGQEGPCFCVWESAKDISAQEFQAFIDGPDGPGAGKIFNNLVHKVPKGMGLLPSAVFATSIPGTPAVVKQAPATAAASENMGVAA